MFANVIVYPILLPLQKRKKNEHKRLHNASCPQASKNKNRRGDLSNW